MCENRVKIGVCFDKKRLCTGGVDNKNRPVEGRFLWSE